jgi:hypothetical protein
MPPPFQGNTLFRRKTMRKLRQLSIAVVLALMLAPGAFAGIIGGGPDPGIIGGGPEPPPEPPSATATGTVGTGASAEPVSATDPAVDVVLDLMQSVLSLL